MPRGTPSLASAATALRSRELLDRVREAVPDPAESWTMLGPDGTLRYNPQIDAEGLSEETLAALAFREEGKAIFKPDTEKAKRFWLWEVAFFASFHALVMGGAVTWYLAVRPDEAELERILRYGLAAVMLSLIWLGAMLGRYFFRMILSEKKLVELEADLFAANLLRDALGRSDPAEDLGRVMLLEERLAPPDWLRRMALPKVTDRVVWLRESVRKRARRLRKDGGGTV